MTKPKTPAKTPTPRGATKLVAPADPFDNAHWDKAIAAADPSRIGDVWETDPLLVQEKGVVRALKEGEQPAVSTVKLPTAGLVDVREPLRKSVQDSLTKAAADTGKDSYTFLNDPEVQKAVSQLVALVFSRTPMKGVSDMVEAGILMDYDATCADLDKVNSHLSRLDKDDRSGKPRAKDTDLSKLSKDFLKKVSGDTVTVVPPVKGSMAPWTVQEDGTPSDEIYPLCKTGGVWRRVDNEAADREHSRVIAALADSQKPAAPAAKKSAKPTAKKTTNKKKAVKA